MIAIVLCTVLALSSALPHHHQWHWSRPGHHSDSELAGPAVAKVQDRHEWHWNRPNHQFNANTHQQSLTATVQGGTVSKKSACETIVGTLDRPNGLTISRSYHLCSQENPAPEEEDILACYYTTTECCAVPGLPLDNRTITMNDVTVTVKFYSVGGQTNLCYRIIPEKAVPSCIPAENCIPGCNTNPDIVCFNNTITGDESSCFNLTCNCKEGYGPPESCCDCVQGFVKVDGICEPLCDNNCEGRDPELGCTRCRPGYGPLPTCCNCTDGFYLTEDESCLPPCRDNIVSCQNGVCTCKEGFGGPDCCQCRDFAVANGCTDDGCVCQDGYAASTCCECAPGYHRAADGTCQPPCEDNIVSCQNGVCTCKDGFGGPDCCQCRDFAVADSCTDTACQCQAGYAAPTCCECAPGYYRAADGTCQPPCTDNIVSCQNGVCTCQAGFGGPDCCQCRDFAVADSCTDTACVCQAGYAAPTCCECAPGYYRAADGTCKPPCTDNIVSCQNGVCTCQAGFGGPDCCQCRDFAVADSCTDTACQCQDGYLEPTCCECAPGYHRAADGTCQSSCMDNVLSCQNGVCTCKDGFGGPDCCQCRDFAVANGCTDNGCICQDGYAAPTCCECAPGYYRAADGTCQPPCEDNIVSCQNGVCTCKDGFGGPDCCQCRDFAVADSCTDTACVCQAGYAAPTCCECAPGYYRAADGTCKPPCTDNIVSCQNGVCTCQAGFGGPDCCQCRDFAVANSCIDTACQCQDGYLEPTCCECAPGYYRAADGTCQLPCTDNIIASCQNGVCTCQAGFGGPDCCQCRDFAVADSCTDTACQCQAGYAAPTCCECAPGYYRAADGTCQPPCEDNIVSCQNGVCTCQAGFGGPDCCQCRDFAVANSCTDTACQCQDGYLEPTCCECDDNYYRDPDGTCKEICVDTAVTCSQSGCTECVTGYDGLGCCECAPGFSKNENGECVSDCSDMQDIYFVVDTTLSNDASPFCTEMYAVELLTEAINPRAGDIGTTRIGSYLYPYDETSPENDMRFFKVGDQSCSSGVEEFHNLMEAVSRGINNEVRDKVLGTITLPARVLDLLARDIEAEIDSGNVPADRRRIVVILTDGPNDSSGDELDVAIERLVKTSDKLTLIAAGIATSLNTDSKEVFMSEIIKMANGDTNNAIVAEESSELGEQLVNVMLRNGAICPERAANITNRLNKNGNVYCKCNLRDGCKTVCDDPPVCRTPPTSLCSTAVFQTQTQEDSLTRKILARVESVLRGYFD